MTECIRAKVNKIRDRKAVRHASQVRAIESDIVRLTELSTALFSNLEDAIEQEALPSQLSVRDSPYRPGSSALSLDDNCLLRGSPISSYVANENAGMEFVQVHSDVDDVADHGKAEALDAQHLAEDATSSAKTEYTAEHVSHTHSLGPDKTDNTVMKALRVEAAEVVAQLQARRALLGVYRQSFNEGIARLEALEHDLCARAQIWEAEERDRLECKNQKRKRDDSAVGMELSAPSKKQRAFLWEPYKSVASLLTGTVIGAGAYYAGVHLSHVIEAGASNL